MKEKKDYYFPVLLVQCLLAVLLTVIISLSGKSSDSFVTKFKEIISDNSHGEKIEDAFISLKDNYLIQENNENENQTELSESENNNLTETENISESSDEDNETEAVGGDDMTRLEAAKNTSFAPIFATAEITPPIENGRYTSYFGYRINPITDEFSFHTGLDIAAAEGTRIRAAFSGQVTKVGQDSRAGKYIFLTHDNGLVTFYCHCSEILAEENAYIRQGETVALVGSTGWSTGPHLHFEVRKDNIRYNPLWLLEDDC